MQVHKKASLLASPVVCLSWLVQGQLTTAWTPCLNFLCKKLLDTEYDTQEADYRRSAGEKQPNLCSPLQKNLIYNFVEETKAREEQDGRVSWRPWRDAIWEDSPTRGFQDWFCRVKPLINLQLFGKDDQIGGLQPNGLRSRRLR